MDTMLSRALREFTSGPLNQLIVNLAGDKSEIWEKEFKRFLRQEVCWPGLKRIGHIINLDADPKDMKPSFDVVMHQKSGKFKFNPKEVVLCQAEAQKNTKRIVCSALLDNFKKDTSFNANLLDFYLEDTGLIPPSWYDKIVLFPGTIFRSQDKELYVRYLAYDDERHEWCWNVIGLKQTLDDYYYVAIWKNAKLAA